METTNFFYIIIVNKYLICDIENCAKSERTIDIKFNELATNSSLLNKLNLVSMYCNESNGVSWFASYLSAFIGHKEGSYEKLLTNPTLRILIEDKQLLKEIKK